MRQEISLKIDVNETDDSLLQVVRILGGLSRRPESLVWSAIPHSGQARVWLVVPIAENCLQSLLGEFKTIPGVHAISLHGPGESVIASLFLSKPGS